MPSIEESKFEMNQNPNDLTIIYSNLD